MATSNLKSKEWRQVWTNTSTSATFASQTVQIANIEKYSEFIVCFKYTKDASMEMQHYVMNPGVGVDFLVFGYSLYPIRRSNCRVGTGTFTFGDGARQSSFNGTWPADNTYCWPTRIFAR